MGAELPAGDEPQLNGACFLCYQPLQTSEQVLGTGIPLPPAPRFLAILIAAAVGMAPAAWGATSRTCRVPDVYLTLQSDLDRTESLVDGKRPVRVLVLGPEIGAPLFSERKRSRLEQELSRRLPGVPFTIVDDGPATGTAELDFERIRSEASRTEPDLLIWQVGTSDALAHADPERFGAVLNDAVKWLKERRIDLVLLDPPFVPNVDHEHIYWKIVGKISEVSDSEGVALFRRYAATQYLEVQQQKSGGAQGSPDQQRICMPELLAEAIVRSVTR
jgi:acyl-CoA thioesterase-1